VGIACAGTGSAEAIALLEPMMDDVADFVRQAAMLGLAMVYMQQSEVRLSLWRSCLALGGRLGAELC
jgi:26S proteasome regulatory subunit N2